MSDDEQAVAVALLLSLCVVLLAIAFGLGTVFGDKWANDRWRIDAVANGHAEYITQDGTPVWQWRQTQDSGR